MPFDGAVVSAVAAELRNKITQAKIEKIYQPDKDALIFNIRSYKESHKLLLSASPVYPRINLTFENKSNPEVPPSFCMLLRKHLTGARILSVEQPGLERIIEITLECFDELGYSNKKAIVIEIMGRHSNIIFIDKAANQIIDSIKRVDFEMSSVREILPGRTYVQPPAGERQNPLGISPEIFFELIGTLPGSLKADKFLGSKFDGISPALAREICYQADLDSDTDMKHLDAIVQDRLYKAFRSIMDRIENGEYTPNIMLNESKPQDFSCFDLGVYGDFDKRFDTSMSHIIESFYSEKDLKDRMKQKTSDLNRLISSRLDRCYKKLEVLNDELQQAQNSDIYKIYGDLLTSNLHQIKKGQPAVQLQNYYSEDSELLEIPMDILLTPVQNTQRYYKQYNKSKTAMKIIAQQLEENKEEIQYLEAQQDNLDKCTEELEINEIRNELAQLGYLKRRNVSGKQKQAKPSKPMHFLSDTGVEIFVGKNNVQNDFLTLKLAAPNDIWMHTKDIPGSHVIIKTNGQSIDDGTLLLGANLSAFYSKGRMSSKVPVDYTQKRNVKKPNGAKPGMVIYENNKTIYVTPDEKLIKDHAK